MPLVFAIAGRPLRCRRALVAVLAAVIVAAIPGACLAEDESTAAVAILSSRCGRCHGPQVKKAGLDLTSRAAVLRGGESGPAAVAALPDESLLLEMIHDGSMPVDGNDPPTEEEVALLTRWIEAGLPGADDPGAAAAPEVSQHDVTPIMLLRCTVCHGGRQQEGGLDLRTRESMLRGGMSGPAILPGDPDASLLLKRIHAGEMPPRRRVIEVSVKPMEPGEIETLTRWIAAGAPLAAPPSELPLDIQVTDEDRQFWSFQPPRAVEPPAVNGAARARNAVDAFILAKLESKGLTLSAEADRRVLLRRATYDLTGLPPTPEESDAFLADERADAYERLIDRLLDSPHYGERWARYWLDLAGYADSDGVQNSDPVRSNAWRYRDYVIRAFNADKPYDRFLTEQLAGDELADHASLPTITPEQADQLTATGFLRMAPDGTFACVTGFVPDRLEVINAELEVLTSSVMGLTLRCARCHSHKFDPLPQRDYYRLAAIFKGAYDEHDWLKPTSGGQGSLSPFPVRDQPHVASHERLAWEASTRQLDAEVAKLEQALDQRTVALRAAVRGQRLAELPEAIRADVAAALDAPAEQRTAVQQYLSEKFGPRFVLDAAELSGIDADYKQASDQTAADIAAVNARRQPEPTIRALWDRGQPSPTFVLRRGNYLTPGEPVAPGVPEVLADPAAPYVVEPPWEGARQTGRRLAFARWLTRPNHPLTARVLVNRVWRHHFGAGLVRTLDNFGRTGAAPTHPELLDWLAVEFVRQGWSIKQLHRLMMTSSTYRQSSSVTGEHERLDPENHLLSRMPLRRLEAEALRDTLLAIAGRLDWRPFGPPDEVDQRPDGLVTERGGAAGWRRSVYVLQRRTQVATLLEAFDLARMNPNCIDRSESTVAPQALLLLNNRHVRDLADSFAARLIAEEGDLPDRQIRGMYRLALSREPTAQEASLSLAALAQLTSAWQTALAADPDAADSGRPAARRALGNLCHAIMNSAELMYVD
jgi:hypothetical protein